MQRNDIFTTMTAALISLRRNARCQFLRDYACEFAEFRGRAGIAAGVLSKG
jgi:hypothetical protein